MLNEFDRRLLRQFQAQPEASHSELSELCGMSAATVSRRLDRLRRDGVIIGLKGQIDWHKLGFEVEVSLRVTLDKTEPQAFEHFLEAARKVREVLEIQTFLGQVDVRLSVIARDMEHYQQVYREKVLVLPHIADIEALMHVSRVKTAMSLPL